MWLVPQSSCFVSRTNPPDATMLCAVDPDGLVRPYEGGERKRMKRLSRAIAMLREWYYERFSRDPMPKHIDVLRLERIEEGGAIPEWRGDPVLEIIGEFVSDWDTSRIRFVRRALRLEHSGNAPFSVRLMMHLCHALRMDSNEPPRTHLRNVDSFQKS